MCKQYASRIAAKLYEREKKLNDAKLVIRFLNGYKLKVTLRHYSNLFFIKKNGKKDMIIYYNGQKFQDLFASKFKLYS